MSAQRQEVIDEFAPASAGVEEGTYLFTYEKAYSTTGQYGDQNVHVLRFTELDEETINVYTAPKMSKGSMQRQLIEAFIGRELADGEQVTPRMLKGKQAYGDIEMNKNDKPKVVKMRKVRTAVTIAPEPVAAVAAPKRPAPPARPVATLASDEQRNQIRDLAAGSEMDDASLDAWIGESYAGKTLATITPDEATALIEALKIPF
jgi:hypothetical protein